MWVFCVLSGNPIPALGPPHLTQDAFSTTMNAPRPDAFPTSIVQQASLGLAAGLPSLPALLAMEFADVLLEKSLPTSEEAGTRRRLTTDLRPALLDLSQHILSQLSSSLVLRSAARAKLGRAKHMYRQPVQWAWAGFLL